MFTALHRLPWLCLTWSCIALGALGTLLPLLPTTPFLLVAAWAAPKGSPSLARWLQQHPHFGPLLQAWHTHRAVPRQAKRLAVALLASSWLTLWLLNTHPGILVFTAGLFALVAGFLLTRPTPRD